MREDVTEVIEGSAGDVELDFAIDHTKISFGRMYEVSTGSAYVYVMHFPRDKPRLLGIPLPQQFHVKIGETEHHPKRRVKQMFPGGTGLSEYPVFPYVFVVSSKTEAEQLETEVKRKLGHRKASGPGADWYLSTPDEMKKIILAKLTEDMPFWRRWIYRLKTAKDAKTRWEGFIG